MNYHESSLFKKKEEEKEKEEETSMSVWLTLCSFSSEILTALVELLRSSSLRILTMGNVQNGADQNHRQRCHDNQSRVV